MDRGNKKDLSEAFIEIYEKLDKYVGILAAIVAALTFAKGDRLVSYAFVVIGYLLIAPFLWRAATQKPLLRSIIVTPSPLPGRRDFDFPKSQRIAASIALVLLTLMSIGWIGVNGWQDFKRLTTPALQPRQPSVVVLPKELTPSKGGVPAITSTVTSPSRASDIRFAGEKLVIYDCIVGESRSLPGDVWVVTAGPQEVRVGTDDFAIGNLPETELIALLLAPTRIVVNELSLVVDEYSPPIQPSEIQLYALQGCGAGGGVVEKTRFEEVVLKSSWPRYILVPLTIEFPYYLDEGEALDLHIPIQALESGVYVLHLKAGILGFAGEDIAVESAPISYKSIRLDTLNASEIILR